MAQLAGERCIHHRRLYVGPGAAFHRQLAGIEIASELVDDSRHSLVSFDGGLHSLSFCAGEGARHVAKPAAATASAGAGIATWRGCALAAFCRTQRDNAVG